MAMKSIKALKAITTKAIKVPKLKLTHLSGMKTSVVRLKSKSVKKF